MLPFAGNYHNDKRFAKTNWLCLCGESPEDQSHLMSGSCSFYGDLVDDAFDPAKDDHLVDLFSAILERRDKHDRLDENVLRS